MALLEALHTVGRGFAVDDAASVTSSSVLPGIDQDTTDAVPGSIHLFTGSPAGIYEKIAAGAGTDKWRLMGAAQVGQLSWREIADVKDDIAYANIAAAQSAVNGGTIDGVTIIEGSRILFTNITGENKNIFVVKGAPPAATLEEDPNAATDGDKVVVTGGTDGGKQFCYDGTEWVLQEQSLLDELQYLREFIGKGAAGADTPDYASDTFIADGDSLEVAAGKLDAAMTAQAIAIAAAALNAQQAQTNGTAAGVSTQQAVDSVNVDNVQSVRWIVKATQGSNFRQWKIDASHNGTPSTDATDLDRNRYGRLKKGNIPGIKVDVSLSGAGASQVLTLDVEANSAVDVHWSREVLL